ncbi:prepilin-type N-terminal cleavage/methylation domain-containing protein [Microcoleus vaginatus GB1-A2]|uniref:prepilin-type N-terminal cleavage/methylation domain-containing protein n=1 Tax=Microcoleus vaginatus TaxID=119532 RepID=UPI0016838891|nr:prepilin-type N-terminal cleavage/methylation domain-containing protein [Microcoleus sp. FACHB-61]
MKTPPILLKVLHKCAAKPSPNFNKTASRKGDGGFTLLEVLVIALIIGILSSIAAPSWLAFINRQRVRTVNDRVFQSLRLAQSEAKRTKRDITITFSAPSVDPPTVTFDPPLATGGSTQTLDGGGEIKPGTIALVSNATSITFDYQGNVKDQLPQDTVNPNVRRFVATVSPVKGGGKQCAIVETIIGGMRTAEGNDPVTGCP